jgi:hypothetical protein
MTHEEEMLLKIQALKGKLDNLASGIRETVNSDDDPSDKAKKLLSLTGESINAVKEAKKLKPDR